MKFTTNHNKCYKEWKSGNVRILNDVYANVFNHYSVQQFDGTRWIAIRSFRTLAEAKIAAQQVIENAAINEAA